MTEPINLGEPSPLVKRRLAAHERACQATAHLPRERAMFLVSSWLTVEQLEDVADFLEDTEMAGRRPGPHT